MFLSVWITEILPLGNRTQNHDPPSNPHPRQASHRSQHMKDLLSSTCSHRTEIPPHLCAGWTPLGMITEVSARTVYGVVAKNADRPIDVGEFLAIPAKESFILGTVTSLAITPENVSVEIDLRYSLRADTPEIVHGVTSIPAVDATIFRPAEAVVRAILEERSSLSSPEEAVALRFGISPLCPSTPLEIPPEKIFGRHCAVVGTSGSGKSWTVARLIEESAHHRSKIILIDPSGEYAAMRERIFHCSIGSTEDLPSPGLATDLPLDQLTEGDLLAIIRPTSVTQINKLRAAIRTLKLLRLEPRLSVEGNYHKAQRTKATFEQLFAEWRDEINKNNVAFDFRRLPLQIELECVDPVRSECETSCWGSVNARERTECISMITAIEELLASEELKAIVRPEGNPGLFPLIDRFLADPSLSVLRISFENLPTSHRVREIYANAIARHLLRSARAGGLSENPLVFVVDEAHQMIPTTPQEPTLDAFNVIAKEGRKYGLTLCVVTQRPGDIPEDLLSQVGTVVAHRLVNEIDRRRIERMSTTSARSLDDELPSLPPGEAYLLGIEFPTALRLGIVPPLSEPRSRGPNFQAFWRSRA